jgi:seryl-tRNA synthetase
MKTCKILIAQDPAIPPSLIREVRSRLAYIDEAVAAANISANGGEIELVLRGSVNGAHEIRLRANVQALVQSIWDGSFQLRVRVVEDHAMAVTYDQDPIPELLARREVVQGGPGYFVLGPMMARLVEFIETQLVQVASHMHAVPYRFPALISPAYLEKVQYFRSFPHSLSFVTHLREDVETIQRFASVAATKDGAIATDKSVHASCRAMLSPTLCHHLYFALSGSNIGMDGLVATASGQCFRYESINMVSLERVWNFTMREIIFVGTDKQTKAWLDEVRDRIRTVLKDMHISYRVMTATDPFFIDVFRSQAQVQQTLELKFEIQADLPYKRDSIAVGSYNSHGNFFGRSMNIRLADGFAACTACFAMGFERLALAFVAQHGLDTARWPPAVREGMSSYFPARNDPPFP